MKVFLTGASGFIGSHVYRELVMRGHAVARLLRHISDPVAVESFPSVKGTLADVTAAHLAGADVLVHLATFGWDPKKASHAECFRINVEEPERLWRAALAAGVRRFVIAGSCFEYGRACDRYEFIPADAPLEPIGPYAESKAEASRRAEKLAAESGASVALLRPFHVFGDGECPSRFYPQLVRAAIAGEDMSMTAGEQVRDFTPVALVVRAIVDAVETPPPGFVVRNVGTGQPTTLRAFAERIWAERNARGKLLFGALPYRAGEIMRCVPAL